MNDMTDRFNGCGEKSITIVLWVKRRIDLNGEGCVIFRIDLLLFSMVDTSAHKVASFGKLHSGLRERLNVRTEIMVVIVKKCK